MIPAIHNDSHHSQFQPFTTIPTIYNNCHLLSHLHMYFGLTNNMDPDQSAPVCILKVFWNEFENVQQK